MQKPATHLSMYIGFFFNSSPSTMAQNLRHTRPLLLSAISRLCISVAHQGKTPSCNYVLGVITKMGEMQAARFIASFETDMVRSFGNDDAKIQVEMCIGEGWIKPKCGIKSNIQVGGKTRQGCRCRWILILRAVSFADARAWWWTTRITTTTERRASFDI